MNSQQVIEKIDSLNLKEKECERLLKDSLTLDIKYVKKMINHFIAKRYSYSTPSTLIYSITKHNAEAFKLLMDERIFAFIYDTNYSIVIIVYVLKYGNDDMKKYIEEIYLKELENRSIRLYINKSLVTFDYLVSKYNEK